ncbi:MAG: class I SAM-dependent methyltransferase [Kiritimatiellae bacterium]|nr:class I SAM-dependent methyltransferase [Kiritimatiellia bacterium]
MAFSAIALHRRYWNELADTYQRRTRIALDDFHYGPQIPGEKELQLLPTLGASHKALELGCGAAQNSIWLARRGVACTAVDVSAAQLRHARRLARTAGVRIAFRRAPLERCHQRLHGKFDLVHSSHALEFVDDPATIIGHAARRLVPGGTLMISTVHPLYNGEWVESTDARGRPDGMGLFLRHYFEPPDDVRTARGRVRVISRAYPLSSWFAWLRQAGLEVRNLLEPPAVAPGIEAPYTSKAWAEEDGELRAIPGTVIFIAGRPCNCDPVTR